MIFIEVFKEASALGSRVLVQISSVLLKRISVFLTCVPWLVCWGSSGAQETALVQVMLNRGICSWCCPVPGEYSSMRTKLESA